jgi:DNA-directed RNA polymerase specialized sigma24 family protein
MTINNLYERARNGDKSAEAEMFKKLTDRFWVFAHRRVWDKTEAEELVQNALATVAAEYCQTEVLSSFSAWAHKVLENKFLAYIQARKRRQGRSVSLGSVDFISNNWIPDPTLKMRLLNCLKLVSRSNQRYARILNLHSLGFKRAEICEKLGMTIVQSYVVMSRARAMLKKCLDKEEGNNE